MVRRLGAMGAIVGALCLGCSADPTPSCTTDDSSVASAGDRAPLGFSLLDSLDGRSTSVYDARWAKTTAMVAPTTDGAARFEIDLGYEGASILASQVTSVGAHGGSTGCISHLSSEVTVGVKTSDGLLNEYGTARVEAYGGSELIVTAQIDPSHLHGSIQLTSAASTLWVSQTFKGQDSWGSVSVTTGTVASTAPVEGQTITGRGDVDVLATWSTLE